MFNWMLRRLLRPFGSPSSITPVDPGVMTIFDLQGDNRLLTVGSGQRSFDLDSGRRVFWVAGPSPTFSAGTGQRVFWVPREGEPC